MPGPPLDDEFAMNRRTLVRTTAALAGAGGLAGCTGILGPDCGTPDEELTGAIPRDGEFSLRGKPLTESGDPPVVKQVFARYLGPDGGSYSYGITRFEDADAAEAEMADSDSDADRAFGWVRVEAYVYYAFGPEQSKIEALLAESKPLGKGCVDERVQFA